MLSNTCYVLWAHEKLVNICFSIIKTKCVDIVDNKFDEIRCDNKSTYTFKLINSRRKQNERSFISVSVRTFPLHISLPAAWWRWQRYKWSQRNSIMLTSSPNAAMYLVTLLKSWQKSVEHIAKMCLIHRQLQTSARECVEKCALA